MSHSRNGGSGDFRKVKVSERNQNPPAGRLFPGSLPCGCLVLLPCAVTDSARGSGPRDKVGSCLNIARRKLSCDHQILSICLKAGSSATLGPSASEEADCPLGNRITQQEQQFLSEEAQGLPVSDFFFFLLLQTQRDLV